MRWKTKRIRPNIAAVVLFAAVTGAPLPFAASLFAFPGTSPAGVVALAAAAEKGEADIRVDVALSRREIFQGEQVGYTVTVRGTKTPAPPNLSELKRNFKVVSLGSRSLNEFSTVVIGNHMTQSVRYARAYDYRLTPKRAGTLRLPEPKVEISGRTYKGRALLLRVIAPERQDAVLVEILTDRNHVYPTQTFAVTVRVYLKALPDPRDEREPLKLLPPPRLSLPWLDVPQGLRASCSYKTWLGEMLSRDGRGFKIKGLNVQDDFFFAARRTAVLYFPHRVVRRAGLDGKVYSYHLYELPRIFTAEKVGRYVFGPVTFKGRAVVGQVKQHYTTKMLVVVGKAKTVEVREVPNPRPADYCGGLGEYTVTAAVEPTVLPEGAPLTLTLAFERRPGAASLERIAPPDLTRCEALTRDFVVIDKEPVGVIKDGVKRFRYGLRAKRAGVSLPPLTVSSFDPEREKFITYTLAPPELTVQPAEKVEVVTAAPPTGGKTELKTTGKGVFQAAADVRLLGNERPNERWFVAYPLALLVLFLVLRAVVLRRERLLQDEALRRRAAAWPEARRRLAEAEKAWRRGDFSAAVPQLRGALLGLVANLLNRPAAGLTAKDAAAALAVAGVVPAVRNELISFLDELDGFAYGGSAPAVDKVSSPLARARKLAGELRKLSPGKR